MMRSRRTRFGLFAAALLALTAAGVVWGRTVWSAKLNHAARQALSLRHWDEAERALSTARSLRIGSAETDFLWGRLQRRLGRADEARVALVAARRRGWPADQIVREERLIEAQSSSLRRAYEYLGELLSNPGEDGPEIYDVYATRFVRSRVLPRRAFELLLRWSTERPSDARPRRLTGELCLLVQDWARAETELRQAIELNPRERRAALLLGQLLLDRQSPAEAAEWFERAAEKDVPNSGTKPAAEGATQAKDESAADSETRKTALTLLAKCRRELGQLDEARAAAEDAGSATELARLDLEAGRVEQAVARLEAARDRSADDLDFRSALAEAWQRAGRTAEARAEREAVQTAVQQRGRARLLVRQLLDDSENLELRRQLGRIGLEFGPNSEGIVWLESVLELQSNDRAALELLVAYYEDRGDRDPAARRRAVEYRARLGRY
ncbi:MAG TPA: tetratricopeptide repeat protein [Pirellulaceae bacterium]|nr:tetratricopeptide repeat protein [Pirellulaceae bacterium]